MGPRLKILIMGRYNVSESGVHVFLEPQDLEYNIVDCSMMVYKWYGTAWYIKLGGHRIYWTLHAAGMMHLLRAAVATPCTKRNWWLFP